MQPLASNIGLLLAMGFISSKSHILFAMNKTSQIMKDATIRSRKNYLRNSDEMLSLNLIINVLLKVGKHFMQTLVGRPY